MSSDIPRNGKPVASTSRLSATSSPSVSVSLQKFGGDEAVDRAVVPDDALRNSHLVGKHGAFVEFAVAVRCLPACGFRAAGFGPTPRRRHLRPSIRRRTAGRDRRSWPTSDAKSAAARRLARLQIPPARAVRQAPAAPMVAKLATGTSSICFNLHSPPRDVARGGEKVTVWTPGASMMRPTTSRLNLPPVLHGESADRGEVIDLDVVPLRGIFLGNAPGNGHIIIAHLRVLDVPISAISFARPAHRCPAVVVTPNRFPIEFGRLGGQGKASVRRRFYR